MTTDRARISAEEEASSQAPPGRREDNASAIPPTVALPGAASRPPLAPPPRPGRGFAPLRTATLLGMQQTLGNRAVQRLLQRAKADAAPGPAAQDQDLAARLRNAGDGQPLDASAQGRLEAGLGADLSGVRVHADAEADRLSRAVEATAFTTGSDIFFRAGAYNPASSGGLQTLAHEAAHVVQQAAGPVAGTPAPGGVAISDPGDADEQAATQAATRVLQPTRPLPGEAASLGERFGGTVPPASSPAVAQRTIIQDNAKSKEWETAEIGTEGRFELPDAQPAPTAQPAPVQLQRSIAPHEVRDAANQNPAGPNVAATRRNWLKGLLQPEIRRLVPPQPNLQQADALYALQHSNSQAYEILNNELLPYVQPNPLNPPVNYANALMQDDILTINEILNRLEQALNAKNVAPKDIANVLIGNEFTFTNDTLSGLDAEDKDDLHEQMIKPYNALATAWKNAMTNRGIAPFQEYQKDRMLMLTYKFQSAQHGLDWEYKVTPDQKCVEIITSPAKGVDIYGGHVGNYADHYIFNVAQEIQLSAHATIGGGHINIDEKSAFGNYGDLDAEGARRAARVLANFMQEFYTDAAYWEERDTDVPNSPFPKDLTYEAGKNNTITKTKQEDFEALIVKFNQAGWGIEKLADELIDKVFDINLVEASKRESPHYQALNTEHLSSKEQGGTRRLEVRRVPAQSTRQMLMTQLTRIAGLLKVAKERAR